LSEFYTAGTFWAGVAGVIGTLVLGLAGTWFVSRQVPKRRLLYRMTDPVALLASPGILPVGLEIRRLGEVVKDPRIATVIIQSYGRQSIGVDLFSQGRPLLLEMGVPLLDILKVKSRPREQAIPDYKVSETCLMVGPSGLAAKQRIEFSLLVDGEPDLTVISNLPDVKVQRQQGDSDPAAKRIMIAGSAVAAIASGLVLALVLTTATPIKAPTSTYEGSRRPVSWAQGKPTVVTTVAHKILTYAYAHIGAPYVWGGAGPNNFDSSGLVMAALQYAGVTVPHLSYDQMGLLPRVSLRNLQPGDILGFNANSSVAIYIGDGKLIDCPDSGSDVEVLPLSGLYAQNLDGAVRP